MTSPRFLAAMSNAKQVLRLQSLPTRNQQAVQKGHVAVYVGDAEKKRYTVPITYLSHPSFKQLLRLAEEEFGFNHSMGGLTIPCDEQLFLSHISIEILINTRN